MTRAPLLSRERDDELLNWVARRAAGESTPSIAASAGVGRGAVVLATNNVRKHDAATAEDIAGAYW